MKASRPALTVLCFAAVTGALLACGGSPSNCSPTGLALSPAGGSADHTSVAPANQVQFSAQEVQPPGCRVLPITMPIVAWTTSDPANTTIDSNGVATCINATPQAVTIRGTLRSGSLTGTATLSCK